MKDEVKDYDDDPCCMNGCEPAGVCPYDGDGERQQNKEESTGWFDSFCRKETSLVFANGGTTWEGLERTAKTVKITHR